MALVGQHCGLHASLEVYVNAALKSSSRASFFLKGKRPEKLKLAPPVSEEGLRLNIKLGCPQKQGLCNGCVVKELWWLCLVEQKGELGGLAGWQVCALPEEQERVPLDAGKPAKRVWFDCSDVL